MIDAARFEAFCDLLTVESGARLVLEDWQRRVLGDFFAGAAETVILIPKKNGKTTLLAAIGLAHLIYEPDAEAVVAATSRDQAMLLYGQAAGFVRRSSDLAQLVNVHGGMRELRAPRTGGRLRVIAADADTADGWLGDLALVDEMHRARSAELYRVLRDGLGPRKGRLLAITTAGEDEDSPLGEMRRQALRLPHVRREGAYTHATNPDRSFAWHEYSLWAGADWRDMAVVKQANPASWQTEEVLRTRFESPSMSAGHWQRFVAGLWVRTEDTAITAEQWDALVDAAAAIEPAAAILVGMDLGWTVDAAALVPIAFDPDRTVVGDPVILEPPVDEHDIVAGLLDLAAGHEAVTVVFDPNAGGRQLVQLLERGDHPVQTERGSDATRLDFVEHSQDNTPVALASQRLDEAIRRGALVHTGHPGLRAHVLNAVRRELGGERWRYDRPKRGKRRPTDALTGLLIAYSTAVAEADNPPQEFVFEVFS